MRGYARLWLLRRSLALEISSQLKKQSRRSRDRPSDNSIYQTCALYNSVRKSQLEYGTFLMEKRRRRQPRDDDKRGRRNKMGRRGTKRTRIEGTNERTNERNRGACMNGELLFVGLLSWLVGPSFVYSVRLLRLLVPSIATASSSSSPVSPKHVRPALASVLLFL